MVCFNVHSATHISEKVPPFQKFCLLCNIFPLFAAVMTPASPLHCCLIKQATHTKSLLHAFYFGVLSC